MADIPYKQIRAVYDDTTIRVYQAYNDQIADAALAKQTFTAPFRVGRMTWIKPSFLWMMYRAGYGHKDEGQKRILAIDITHSGFAWALEHSCGSHIPPDMTRSDWNELKARTAVRIQWDPERDLHHNPLAHRSIQIGLKGEAVEKYINEWIVNIEDITPTAHRIYELIQAGDEEEAKPLLPNERPYTKINNHESYG